MPHHPIFHFQQMFAMQHGASPVPRICVIAVQDNIGAEARKVKILTPP
jgi:hypothetical protein